MNLTPHEEGMVLSVRAQPGARRNGVVGEHAGALKVAVTAAPEQGKANQAILEVLRDNLNLKRSQLELVGGIHSRDKQVLVRGVTHQELQSRLAALLR